MGIPIIIVLISLVFQTEALIADDRGQSALFQTGQPFDAQLIGPIESGDSFGVGGMLPALGLPLLGLLLLLGLTGGATRPVTPSTPCPICPMIPTTPCPPPEVCNPVPDCPPGFERHGSPGFILNKCYRKVTGPFATFFDAQAACYAAGGTLAEFTNLGEQFAVTTFAGVGTYYIGYSEFRNGVPGRPRGAISDQAEPVGFFTGGTTGTTGAIDCGTLVNGAGILQDCATPVQTGGICEARIDPTAVRCVCP